MLNYNKWPKLPNIDKLMQIFSQINIMIVTFTLGVIGSMAGTIYVSMTKEIVSEETCILAIVVILVADWKVKTSAVCGPHLQSSAEEEVVQTSAVCTKKTEHVRRKEQMNKPGVNVSNERRKGSTVRSNTAGKQMTGEGLKLLEIG
ncbi:hypothetical protein LXL04_030781 [Taraxacum kok-saghyz]